MTPRPDSPAAELQALAARALEAAASLRKAQPEARSFSALLETPASRDAALSAPSPGSAQASAPPAGSLAAFRAQPCGCALCTPGVQHKSMVFGEGDPQARLVFLGDLPEVEDEVQGRPFTGPAGQLLSRILSAMNLKRSEVYLLNLAKVRPPQGRLPSMAELEGCKLNWKRHLALLKPKAICALGEDAARALSGGQESFPDVRGRFFVYEGLPVMPTYHPSYILKQEQAKRQVWEDMKALLKKLESLQ